MAKPSNVSITDLREGKALVHAGSDTGNYDTACGLDGDDPRGAETGKMHPTVRRITCQDCYQMWQHFQQFKATDFSDAVRQRTP